MTYLFEYYAYFLIANKQIKVRMNQKPKQESKIDAEFRRIYAWIWFRARIFCEFHKL